ncbi:hypothetical protein OG906_40120 (plasmid) [Streptomyces sp. NBC_01426]|uniref:hypothetical protein n=1 Tax=Streptomyces sp. NBC_01426 TaxID=2975866 RepID=UPI002E366F0C|nr:hypothetical protein [Streptomyces sp. NBC_01426]
MTMTAHASGNHHLRLSGLLAVPTAATALACLTLAAPTAAAAEGASPVDLALAGRAAGAQTSLRKVEAFLAVDQQRLASGARLPGPDGSGAVDGAAGPTRLGATLAVYVLNPDFVRGVPGAPPNRPEGAATTVTGANGRTATIRTAPTERGWQVVSSHASVQ